MIYNQDFEASVAEGEAKKQAALDRVAENNKAFIDAAIFAIKGLCNDGGEITSDDVWLRIDYVGVANPKAMGVAFFACSKMGLIKATDKFRQSCRPVCHRRPLRVWEVL